MVFVIVLFFVKYGKKVMIGMKYSKDWYILMIELMILIVV